MLTGAFHALGNIIIVDFFEFVNADVNIAAEIREKRRLLFKKSVKVYLILGRFYISGIGRQLIYDPFSDRFMNEFVVYLFTDTRRK